MVDGLQAYLERFGIDAKGRQRLEHSAELTSASTLAVVLFPDDFPREAVAMAIAQLAVRCRATLRVLVTSHPKSYEQLVDGAPNVLVIARPILGWTILDAIRAHRAQPGEDVKREPSKAAEGHHHDICR